MRRAIMTIFFATTSFANGEVLGSAGFVQMLCVTENSLMLVMPLVRHRALQIAVFVVLIFESFHRAHHQAAWWPIVHRTEQGRHTAMRSVIPWQTKVALEY